MITGIKIDEQSIKQVVKVARAQKKISNFDDAEKGIVNLITFIDQINHVPEYQCQIWEGYQIDDIQIPIEFKDFVCPKSVRWIASDRKCEDLLTRVDSPIEFVFKNKAELEIAIQSMRGAFKKDGFSDLVRIGDLRKDVSIMDVIDRLQSGANVRYMDRPFIPVSLRFVGDLFTNGWFNTDHNVVIGDYIADMKFV